ncbi:SAV_915 family protein [Streptomyces xanthophaeus]|uniref:SAV_915 family protein n=1 Tax=Streptomyces xanthophaeus TaxID=67385 RepID=UPI002649E312|nr:SAV_915 family protein [Streptomyces xanthophaeus]
MCLFQYEDDPEPEERVPAGPLYVPVLPGTAEVVVRLFRTPLGARTAVGFTSAERLAATLGAGQRWIRLSESALRAMAEPVGASLLTVDPTLTAPAVTGAAAGTAAGTAAGAVAAPVTQAPETVARTL